MKRNASPRESWLLGLYALTPPLVSIPWSASPPDHPLPFALVYAVFFAYSEFCILIASSLTGLSKESAGNVRVRCLLRAMAFPSFAFILLLADGQERSFTGLDCALAIALTSALESLRKLVLAKTGHESAQNFALSLATVLVASVAGFALDHADAIFAIGSTTTLALVLSTINSRSRSYDAAKGASGAESVRTTPGPRESRP